MADQERIQSAYEAAVTNFIEHREEKALYSVSKVGKEMVRERLSPDVLLDVHAKAVKHLLQCHAAGEMGLLAMAANDVLSNGMMAYAMSYHSLVSAMESKQHELEKANRQLKELDQLKSIFIATMSHELRTPLNSIIGFTSVLLEDLAGEITDEQSELLNIVNTCGHQLLALVNDIIDISKIEADKMDLSIELFDLPTLIRTVANTFTVAVKAKGLELHLGIPEILSVESDEHRIRQILVNLVNNAVKFTDSGSVAIDLLSDDGWAEISVRDTGIGIGAEDLDKLFKPFSQIVTDDRAREGSGLGLYLSRKICTLLGGDIRFKSEQGEGSVFTVRLPLRHKG